MTNKVEVEREDLHELLGAGGVALALLARQCDASGTGDSIFHSDLKMFYRILEKYLGDGDE